MWNMRVWCLFALCVLVRCQEDNVTSFGTALHDDDSSQNMTTTKEVDSTPTITDLPEASSEPKNGTVLLTTVDPMTTESEPKEKDLNVDKTTAVDITETTTSETTPMSSIETTSSKPLHLITDNEDKSNDEHKTTTMGPGETMETKSPTNMPPTSNPKDNTTPRVPEASSSVTEMDNHVTDVTTLAPRRHKQLDLAEEACTCDASTGGFDPASCVGGRTVSHPNCPCLSVCTRQAGQSCSSAEPCDEEFGLKCELQNNTCRGPLSIEIFEVTHNSAKIKWLSSEAVHQAQAFFSSAYRGPHTQWVQIDGVKPVFNLENLLPGKYYYVKVEEDGKQELSVFKTRDNVFGSMPKILVKQRSQTTLTVVWDDFRLPSYHSEYILEYKLADDRTQNWTKVQAGTQTIVTVSNLRPNTPYNMKVAVWEDEKLELPSEVITAYTADGCVKDNRLYNVGEEYFLECDARCVCDGDNRTSCTPRCNPPYYRVGERGDDPLCYEKPLPSDPCCVTLRCTESKFYGDEGEAKNKSGECPEILEESESESCLSDCDHDGDCSGELKCCPSSCGGAVCVQPLLPQDVCEHIYCGPNAKCVAEKMTCECSEGFVGNPHDFLNGCALVNTTDTSSADSPSMRSSSDLETGTRESHDMKHDTAEGKSLDSKNELETEEDKDRSKDAFPTEAPFQLDLTSHTNKTVLLDGLQNEAENGSSEVPEGSSEVPNGSSEVSEGGSEVPSDEENFHLRRPQDGTNAEGVRVDEMPDVNNQSSNVPIPFDGCDFNNITYDAGASFEDGCEARCTCEGRGHVSCVPRCSVQSEGGATCTEVVDPDDSCCKIMVCSFPGEKEEINALQMKILSALAQNGTSIRVQLSMPPLGKRDAFQAWFRESSDSDNDLSQWDKRVVSKNDLTEVREGVYEFDISDLRPQTDYYIKVGKEGSSEHEFSNTVNVKTFAAAVKAVFDGCFHRNQSYQLGEVFFEGCEHKCVCRERGFIECQDRCEVYIDTVGYEGCDWVPSEEDPCCTIPMCTRRKIPLLPDGRIPFTGASENICIVDNTDVYRVGDIWESGDGCKTKICRCTLLTNGSTSIQCQSECPPLAPNAHIPTARCPHPVLIKPDGPCSCPYVVCNDAPRRPMVQAPRPQCEFKGMRYDMGHEFHDGCLQLCHCGQDLRVNCAPIECPYHFSAEYTNCLEWDIDPNFFPTPPHCCAPAKCINDGSCQFGPRKFANFESIPEDLLPCGSRCVCVNGNVTCENRCPPLEDAPPHTLHCDPSMAVKGHVEGDNCCMQWMCKEPLAQNFCLFQGSRYMLHDQWEVVQKQQKKHCECRPGDTGPQVECRGGCPPIPPRFLLPTEQCLRPVTVTPDDPLMCPYVVCNNTLSGQELYNVNVVSLNTTAVRIRFSLSNILVGLVGHAELHFTTDPTLPPAQWHTQKFSRPKRLFDSPNIEYVLNALRPNTTYFLRIRIKIDALQGGPESELFKLTMPEEVIQTTTTTLPPMLVIDAKAEAHIIDSRTVRISWRNFEPSEKKYIYALQLKYKKQSEDKWTTTPMIHRDVTSYFLHDLEASQDYVVDVVYTPPKDMPTTIVSAKGLEFRTTGKMKDDYHLQVAVDDNQVEEDKSSFSFAGIPDPITKYVHVIKIMYKSTDGEQSYSFKVPKNNHIMLDHLKPGKKYLAQLELYLTNGQTLTSNEVEFITKQLKPKNTSTSENIISQEPRENGGKQAELLQSTNNNTESSGGEAYFIALVVVAVVAAVSAFGFVLLLVLLVKRGASAKAPISRTPSESAYDNPTYKTYDGERPEDKTNGQAMQTTQA